MKIKHLSALALALGMFCATTSYAQEFGGDEILTPTEDDEFSDLGLGDIFGGDFGEEFSESPVDPGVVPDEPSSENTEESTSEESSSESSNEEEEVKTVRNIDSQGKINKKIVALSDKVPGAIQAKGMTFLTTSSAKTIGTYLPCSTTEEQTLMTAFTRLKLSQGAPVDCREDITYRFFPYRMYRRAQ